MSPMGAWRVSGSAPDGGPASCPWPSRRARHVQAPLLPSASTGPRHLAPTGSASSAPSPTPSLVQLDASKRIPAIGQFPAQFS
nr:hypothetical protein CFP56_13147 [Quercus suber]